jgi:hypothetical protein
MRHLGVGIKLENFERLLRRGAGLQFRTEALVPFLQTGKITA